jgi:oligopeptide transport system ATP-binding protein
MMNYLLEVEELVTKFYTVDGVIHAVNGLHFKLKEGETLAIVGESGSGKSVAMMSLLSLLPTPPAKIEHGAAYFTRKNGRRVNLIQQKYHELNDIRGGEVGFIFQDPVTSLNPILPIGKQISESLIRHLGLSTREAYEKSIELLDRVGIGDPKLRYRYYPFQLSGGMRQRVMIAIAVACNPSLVIADEPTTALDVTIQAQIVDLFKKLREDLKMATIWISHDLGLVATLADRVLVMYAGQVVETAKVDDLYERPMHPYTIGLLGAVPGMGMERSKRLVSIEGAPPDLMIPIHHCPFTWRCSRVEKRCWETRPPLIELGGEHEVACFLYE